MTTNEYLRGTFNNIDNPFDNGCFDNCWGFFKTGVGSRNISLNYLVDKKRYDLNATLNSQEDDIRKSDFALEMNMMKTIETLKHQAEEGDIINNGNISIEKKLIPEQHAI